MARPGQAAGGTYVLSRKLLKLKTIPPYVFVTLPSADPRYTSHASADVPVWHGLMGGSPIKKSSQSGLAGPRELR